MSIQYGISGYVGATYDGSDRGDIILLMAGKKKPKKEDRPVFDSIRKPTAPPSKKFGTKVPEEKLRPSLRKAKHKRSPDPEN
ncbi:MAG: hypothetical protein AB7J13_04360 [Pyrinomonadaceae bacterium]